jgi:hypothetical protein
LGRPLPGLDASFPSMLPSIGDVGQFYILKEKNMIFSNSALAKAEYLY